MSKGRGAVRADQPNRIQRREPEMQKHKSRKSAEAREIQRERRVAERERSAARHAARAAKESSR